METLINEKQLSEKLQLSLACLRRWRLCGTGPLYIKVGPLVRYRPEDIETWMADLPRGGEGRSQLLGQQSARVPRFQPDTESDSECKLFRRPERR
jgi:predicted DNA-binding transcriptional regulator AlpA